MKKKNINPKINTFSLKRRRAIFCVAAKVWNCHRYLQAFTKASAAKNSQHKEGRAHAAKKDCSIKIYKS